MRSEEEGGGGGGGGGGSHCPGRGFHLALQPHDVSKDMAKAMLQHAVLLEQIYGKMQKIILLAVPDTDQSDKWDPNRMFDANQVAFLSPPVVVSSSVSLYQVRLPSTAPPLSPRPPCLLLPAPWPCLSRAALDCSSPVSSASSPSSSSSNPPPPSPPLPPRSALSPLFPILPLPPRSPPSLPLFLIPFIALLIPPPCPARARTPRWRSSPPS